MSEEAFASLRQICADASSVDFFSRAIRRSVAIGDGPAVARHAQALATIAARVHRAEIAVRAELIRLSELHAEGVA